MTLNRPMFPPRAEPHASPLPTQIGRRGVLCALAAMPASAVLPSETPLSAVLTEPDPIFAAIEDHRQACDRFSRAVEIEVGLAGYDPAIIAAREETRQANDEMFGRARALHDVMPSTPAGCAALLHHVAAAGDTGRVSDDWRFPDNSGEDDPGEDFANAIMRHVASALGSVQAELMPTAPADRSRAVDPIFAAIEAFRIADERFNQVTAESEACLVDGIITNQERWDAQDRFYEDMFKPALENLISTVPTTLAGLAAMLAFVREQDGVLELIGQDDDQLATYERSVEVAVCRAAGLPVPPMSAEGGANA